MVLNWTGLRDSYGVSIGDYYLAIASVRNTATCCGVIGLKPTYGAVSLNGVFPLTYSLDHVGPMSRNVEDNAILYHAIAGHDPDDPTSTIANRGSNAAATSAALP